MLLKVAALLFGWCAFSQVHRYIQMTMILIILFQFIYFSFYDFGSFWLNPESVEFIFGPINDFAPRPQHTHRPSHSRYLNNTRSPYHRRPLPNTFVDDATTAATPLTNIATTPASQNDNTTTTLAAQNQTVSNITPTTPLAPTSAVTQITQENQTVSSGLPSMVSPTVGGNSNNGISVSGKSTVGISGNAVNVGTGNAIIPANGTHQVESNSINPLNVSGGSKVNITGSGVNFGTDNTNA